jgi:hypothetical protein
MKILRNRLLALLAAPSLALTAACSKPAEASGPEITVYKTPTCGCCRSWVDHLKHEGFRVTTEDMADLSQIKEEHGVPDELVSCHTAVVDGYTVEGHVPADVIRKLLAERPQVTGIAVPGMPMGSPGMEGPFFEPYEVYTFEPSGPVDVFAVR